MSLEPEPINLTLREEPTQEQLARRRARESFVRRYIYFPVVVVAVLLALLVVGLLWLTIVGAWFNVDTNQEFYRSFVAAVADVATMIMLTPVLLLCAIPSVLALALYAYRRQARQAIQPGAEPLPLLWRVENLLISVQRQLAVALPRVANPLISAHGLSAFIKTLLYQIRLLVRRETDRYDS